MLDCTKYYDIKNFLQACSWSDDKIIELQGFLSDPESTKEDIFFAKLFLAEVFVYVEQDLEKSKEYISFLLKHEYSADQQFFKARYYIVLSYYLKLHSSENTEQDEFVLEAIRSAQRCLDSIHSTNAHLNRAIFDEKQRAQEALLLVEAKEETFYDCPAPLLLSRGSSRSSVQEDEDTLIAALEGCVL